MRLRAWCARFKDNIGERAHPFKTICPCALYDSKLVVADFVCPGLGFGAAPCAANTSLPARPRLPAAYCSMLSDDESANKCWDAYEYLETKRVRRQCLLGCVC